jgi:predicted transcriptional regulator
MAIDSEMKNRSEIEIMAAILNASVTNWEYKTTIMNNAGVSHSQLSRYLAAAVEKKLMEYSEVTGLYRTAEAGLVFLKKHEQLCLLFPAISDLPEVSKYNSVVSETYNEQST